ncbi:hypothetical protein JCM11251_001553 [Rhodosporidiobolus azoricus]
MEQDPYFEVKAEVESTLSTLSSLSSSFARLARSVPRAQHAQSEELQYALSELRATLAAIDPDIEELDESVQAVEEPGVARRLGIADKEVRGRRDFVERAKGEIAAIRQQLPASSITPDRSRKRLSATSSAYPPSYHTSTPLEPSDESERDRDPNEEFEAQHQTLLMEQQDRTLTDISGTVGLLRQQAQVIGREVFEQTAMLEELDQDVDRTTSKLAKAQRKMDRFVKEHQNSPASWAIFILMIVLSLLLFIIRVPGPVEAFWRLPCQGNGGALVYSRADPIVNPGSFSGHVHAIHGGSNFNLDMTFETARESKCASCMVKQDMSNYWTPALYFAHANGSVTMVEQVGLLVYYLQRFNDKDQHPIKAFPPGFRMLTGNPYLRSYNDSSPMAKQIGCNCLGGEQPTRRPELPAYNCPNGLRLEIFFPSCWDGENPDSPNHQDHVAYPEGGESGPCPASHPHRLISIFYEVMWSVDPWKDEWENAANTSQPFVLAMGELPSLSGAHSTLTTLSRTDSSGHGDGDGDASLSSSASAPSSPDSSSSSSSGPSTDSVTIEGDGKIWLIAGIGGLALVGLVICLSCRFQCGRRRRRLDRLIPPVDEEVGRGENPIVNPGAVSGHAHAIYGASNFNLDVDFETLRKSKCTSCQVSQDMSAYWTPMLCPLRDFHTRDDKFEAVERMDLLVYYEQRPHADDKFPIKAPPAGFRMLAGNPFRRSYDPDDPTHNNIKIRIFAEYWYSTNPWADRWGDAMNTSQPFVFAMGDPTGYGAHADFLNGWDVDVLQKAVDECTDKDGLIERCTPFKLYDWSNGQTSCTQTSAVDEVVTGMLDKLPGCNKVDAGPKAVSVCTEETVPVLRKTITVGGTLAEGDFEIDVKSKGLVVSGEEHTQEPKETSPVGGKGGGEGEGEREGGEEKATSGERSQAALQGLGGGAVASSSSSSAIHTSATSTANSPANGSAGESDSTSVDNGGMDQKWLWLGGGGVVVVIIAALAVAMGNSHGSSKNPRRRGEKKHLHSSDTEESSDVSSDESDAGGRSHGR